MPSFLKRRIQKILPALLLVTIATHAWTQENAEQKSEQKSELSQPNNPTNLGKWTSPFPKITTPKD